MNALLALGLRMDPPLQPTREQARQWVLEELKNREYQDARPNPISRALDWLWDHINGWEGPGGPGATPGALIVVVVVLVIVVWAVYRTGGIHRNVKVRPAAALGDRTMSAADHRAAADRHAAAGEWNEAVIERFRSIVRELEERTILDGQRGRTADEIAVAAAAAVPQLAVPLVSSARVFDDVRYGDAVAGQPQDDALRHLAQQLAGVRVADLAGLR